MGPGPQEEEARHRLTRREGYVRMEVETGGPQPHTKGPRAAGCYRRPGETRKGPPLQVSPGRLC